MSNQAAFELSSSFINPKYVGLSPFHASRETRDDESPPPLFSSLHTFMMCSKRSLNTRIIGFADPTLLQCVDELASNIKASGWGWTSEEEKTKSMKTVQLRRRGVVDPSVLPWEPKERYLEWLRSEGRL